VDQDENPASGFVVYEDEAKTKPIEFPKEWDLKDFAGKDDWIPENLYIEADTNFIASAIAPRATKLVATLESAKGSMKEEIGLLGCDIAVDANRDGVIKFAGTRGDPELADKEADRTERGNPFRFWVNDDQDDKDISETIPASFPDFADNKIKKIRDMEDFARLNIFVGSLHKKVRDGRIQIGLKWKDADGSSPAIKIWQNKSPQGGDEYLKEENAAKNHLGQTVLGCVQGTNACLIRTPFGNSRD